MAHTSERTLVAINTTRGFMLANYVERADNFWLRLRGLLGRQDLPSGEGLLLTHCSSVHTFGMAFSIDVLHLDGEGRVHAIIPSMKPWRAGPWVPRAATVLELAAGGCGNTQVGDTIQVRHQA